ncbi:alpha/beta hydrolase [Salinimicrobium xinjiangense]|uniref:alpha/beta hydrolase n=1 Tax=Salinimicrobium xinjiangense TaxID=438596 RepID=UPI0003FFBFF3|nr:alpha/beta hydrolase-fold protein [Salinimicrobium xinjiangense]
MKRTFLLLLITAMACKSPQRNIVTEASGLRTSSGTVERIKEFPSQFVPHRNIDVWLPENYPSAGKYQVLYMHDGQMLFDPSFTWNKQEWGVDETMQRLISEDSIPATIVVGIWNSGANRHSEYFPQKPFMELSEEIGEAYVKENEKKKGLFSNSVFSDAYLKFIVEELKPFIDSTYATRPERDATFIAGSSMGGLISWYAVSEYPEVFGGAAAISTHWPGIEAKEDNPVPGMFLGYLRDNLPAPGNHRFYFDYGTETLDALYEPHQRKVDNLMEEFGYSEDNWITRKFEGADHSEDSWKARLAIPLRFLLKN